VITGITFTLCCSSAGSFTRKCSQDTEVAMHAMNAVCASDACVSACSEYGFQISRSSPVLPIMSSGPVHQKAPSDTSSARRARLTWCGVSPQTHVNTYELLREGSEQCFQSMVCSQSMNDDTTPIQYAKKTSTGTISVPSMKLVPTCSSWFTIETYSLAIALFVLSIESRPSSRMRCAMPCERQIADTCSCCALATLRQVTVKRSGARPSSMLQITATMSLEVHESTFCTAMSA